MLEHLEERRPRRVRCCGIFDKRHDVGRYDLADVGCLSMGASMPIRIPFGIFWEVFHAAAMCKKGWVPSMYWASMASEDSIRSSTSKRIRSLSATRFVGIAVKPASKFAPSLRLSDWSVVVTCFDLLMTAVAFMLSEAVPVSKSPAFPKFVTNTSSSESWATLLAIQNFQRRVNGAITSRLSEK